MNDMETLKKNIDEADLLLIGVGEEFFQKSDKFEEEYQTMLFDDRILTLQMEPFFKEVLLKRWLEEHIEENLTKAYSNLAQICNSKNYYIVSLGMDDYIYRWNLEKVVTPCGGRRRFQRKVEEKTEILDRESTEALESEIFQAFDTCDLEKLASFNRKHMNEKLEYNNILSEEYDESGYLDDWNQYLKWVQGTVNRKVCVLELGVSLRLPSVIRWPFEKIVFYNNKAVFYRINERLYQMTAELKDKGISIPENAVTFLGNLFV